MQDRDALGEFEDRIHVVLDDDEGASAALALQPFFGTDIDRWFIARTGYTGEDGFEVMLPAGEAESAWRKLNELGVTSCGLGARDVLRLEAGMPLYGHELTESITPVQAGLQWALKTSKPEFIGRNALVEEPQSLINLEQGLAQQSA